MGRLIRVALVQATSYRDKEKENLNRVISGIETAAAEGAELIVFPEAMNTGYVFTDAKDAYEHCESLGHEFEMNIRKSAKSAGVVVVCGMLARATYPKIENLVIVADGRRDKVGYYRKRFPIRSDKLWFEVRDGEQPVFDTSIGRFGCFICADGRIPEPARLQSLQGVDFLVCPSNWGGRIKYNMHVPARAIENGCWIIGVDKVGVEPGIKYPGGSCVIAPTGEKTVQASAEGEEILYADVPINDTIKHRSFAGINLFTHRRPDLYGILAQQWEEDGNKPYHSPDTIYVAAVVMDPSHKTPDIILRESLKNAEDAVRLDEADFIVFPEMLFHPNRLPDKKELAEWAEIDNHGISKFSEFVRCNDSWIIFDGVERSGKEFYHTTYFIGKDRVERYRKAHLSSEERLLFLPGERLDVFKIGNTTVGSLIGNEVSMPEPSRVLALKGVECLFLPTSWRESGEASILVKERACENQIYVVASNRLDSSVPGSSLIVAPSHYPQSAVTASDPLPQTNYVGRLLPLAVAKSKLVSRNTHVLRDWRVQNVLV